MRATIWEVTFVMLLAGPCLYWAAVLFLACRRCGRFRPLRRGLCYTCSNHLFHRSRM